MSDYQVSMMGTELEGNIQKYISKMNEIVEAGKAETEEVWECFNENTESFETRRDLNEDSKQSIPFNLADKWTEDKY